MTAGKEGIERILSPVKSKKYYTLIIKLYVLLNSFRQKHVALLECFTTYFIL